MQITIGSGSYTIPQDPFGTKIASTTATNTTTIPWSQLMNQPNATYTYSIPTYYNSPLESMVNELFTNTEEKREFLLGLGYTEALDPVFMTNPAGNPEVLETAFMNEMKKRMRAFLIAPKKALNFRIPKQEGE